jgi:DNA polymerase I
MPERTLIAAASNVLVRGYYAVPIDRKSPRGEPVNALFAVARGLTRALAFKRPARAVAVIDPLPRAGWPPLLGPQLPMLRSLVEALGLAVVETDDELGVAASYAQATIDAGDDVIIVGTDKRFAQLVDERVWWYDANKDARYTPEMVYKRFGVGADKIAEWLALVGNPDDGLPGIAGIGANTAPSRPRWPQASRSRAAPATRCASRSMTFPKSSRARGSIARARCRARSPS